MNRLAVIAVVLAGVWLGTGPTAGPAAGAGEPPAPVRPVLVVQTGHTRPITAVAFSADGRQTFTGSDDNRVLAWDAVTGRQLRSLCGLTVTPRSLLFDARRRLVMAAGSSFDEQGYFGQVMLWDTASGRRVESLTRIGCQVHAAAISPDGHWLVAVGQEYAGGREAQGRLLLWDRTTGKAVAALDAAMEEPQAVAFHPDSRRVLVGDGVVAGDDNVQAAIWDVVTQKELRRLSGHSSRITAVAFSADGRRALTGSWDQTAALWDADTGAPLRTLGGHSAGGSEVKHVAFSPDGRWVLTGVTRLKADLSERQTKESEPEIEESAELIVWDAATGLLQRVLRGHTGELTGAVFSPDSRLVASSSEDHTVILWNALTGEQQHVLAHAWEVGGVAFSPDGRQLATAGDEATVWDVASGKKLYTLDESCEWVAFRSGGKQLLTDDVVWNPVTREQVFKLQGPYHSLSAAASSPDGRHLATGYWSGEVVLWDAATGREVRRLKGHRERVRSASFGPDGRTLLTFAGYDEHRAILWDTATGKPLQRFGWARGDDQPQSAALSPDGRSVLTGAESKALLTEAATGRGIRVFGGHTAKINAVAFSPDGRHVLTAGGDDGYDAETKEYRPLGEVIIWEAETGRQLQDLSELDSEAHCAAFSPDGQHVLVGCEDATATIFDAAAGQKVRVLGGQASDEPHVAFTPDGRSLRILVRDRVTDWDLATPPVTRTFPPGGLLFSPDGRHVLRDSPDHTMVLADADTGKEICAFDHPQDKVARQSGVTLDFDVVEFSPDGRRVFTSTRGPFTLEWGTYLWDAQTGQRLRTFCDDKAKADKRDLSNLSLVTAAAFSADGRRLVTGSMGKEAIIWDAATAEKLHTLRGHRYWVTCVAFSPDGKQVASGGGDYCAILWDAVTGQLIRKLEGHTDWVHAVAFSPDGRLVATASGDTTVRLWETATGKPLRTLAGHEGPVFDLAFRPDGQRLLTGSRDGTARLWEVATGQELCALVVLRDGEVVATPDGCYLAPKAALDGVAFRVGDRALPFDLFDLKFNRPDLVLERLGAAPPELIAAYRRAYAARLRKLHFTEAMLSDDFHTPEVAVLSAVPLSTAEKVLKLPVKATDSKYRLDRLNVSVNGVPAYGLKGLDLREHQTGTWQQEVAVELSSGKNTLRVSVLNDRGVASLPETFETTCTQPAPRPDLYLVAIGVSAYADARYRLVYADQDAEALARLWASKNDRFARLHVLRILNQQATKQNILQARQLLMQSRVDDQVVVFLAGHGLLDAAYDYYFATVDTDFRNPAAQGLPYAAIEGLLDGVAARRKLLLIDTCHAGELDRDSTPLMVSEAVPEGQLTARGTQRLVQRESSADAELANSQQLLQEAFADLRRGTGTVVIAASGGAEYALETPAWQHGVFTYAVLQGLGANQADRDGNQQILASELRAYVTAEVRRLTRGRQTPTVRQENLEFDFPLF